MPHLTATVVAVGCAVLVAFGLAIGWGAGRAFQRALDAWLRFRSHVRATGFMFRTARFAALDAAGTLALAAGVLVAAGVVAWMVLR